MHLQEVSRLGIVIEARYRKARCSSQGADDSFEIRVGALLRGVNKREPRLVIISMGGDGDWLLVCLVHY